MGSKLKLKSHSTAVDDAARIYNTSVISVRLSGKCVALAGPTGPLFNRNLAVNPEAVSWPHGSAAGFQGFRNSAAIELLSAASC